IPAAAHAAPPLPTLAFDQEALGRQGVELLLADSPAQAELSLPGQLVARASSAGAARAPRTLTSVRGS
ncbi:LacI family transcriptional regulator, partial [Burkholderia pseudomallei]